LLVRQPAQCRKSGLLPGHTPRQKTKARKNLMLKSSRAF
jgi:hypothetical protein